MKITLSKDQLAYLAKAVSTDTHRPILCNIAIATHKGKLWALATDTRAFLLKSHARPHEDCDWFSVIMPMAIAE
jgi:DNA polymerase III sliding clamp (beta) subunit (PCNA family)